MLILFHVTPKTNLPSILNTGLIPQVGERSEQLKEEPGVFLFLSYEDCETALSQWLGEQFEDPYEELVSLKITLPNDFPLEETCEWELVSRTIIEPKYIEFFKDEG